MFDGWQLDKTKLKWRYLICVIFVNNGYFILGTRLIIKMYIYREKIIFIIFTWTGYEKIYLLYVLPLPVGFRGWNSMCNFGFRGWALPEDSTSKLTRIRLWVRVDSESARSVVTSVRRMPDVGWLGKVFCVGIWRAGKLGSCSSDYGSQGNIELVDFGKVEEGRRSGVVWNHPRKPKLHPSNGLTAHIGPWHPLFFLRLRNNNFLWCGVVSPTPNPQPKLHIYLLSSEWIKVWKAIVILLHWLDSCDITWWIGDNYLVIYLWFI
jgi:hypothetical protein